MEDFEIESYGKKVRAILIDSNKKMVLVEINESLAFPGGTIDEDENKDQAIMRELNEELGISVDSIDYVTSIKHLHKNFPHLRTNTITNRENEVHYYFKKIDSFNLGEQHLTKYEKDNGLSIKLMSYEELIYNLDKPSKNSYKKYMADETKKILNYLIDNGYEVK